MQRLQFPHQGKFNPDEWPRFLAALADALLKYEADSGWVARPANNTFNHKLGRLPGFVQVMESDNRQGDGFNQLLATSVTSANVVFSTASKGYIRCICSF